jgi:preprotein translocase SecE subunit
VARSSRQQRRARRAQTQPALAGGAPAQAPPPPPPRSRQTAGGSDEPSRRPQRTTRERRIPLSGTAHFLQESYGELRKVEWPSQKAVVSGTAVVMIACLIVGTYLWLNDRLWQYVVHHLLLR